MSDIIKLTTNDPETKPLPSLALLKMQWVLMRLAAMCAAGEKLGISSDSDDDDPLHKVDAYGRSPMVWSWSPPTGEDSTPQFDAQVLFHILNSMAHGDTEGNLTNEEHQDYSVLRTRPAGGPQHVTRVQGYHVGLPEEAGRSSEHIVSFLNLCEIDQSTYYTHCIHVFS